MLDMITLEKGSLTKSHVSPMYKKKIKVIVTKIKIIFQYRCRIRSENGAVYITTKHAFGKEFEDVPSAAAAIVIYFAKVAQGRNNHK